MLSTSFNMFMLLMFDLKWNYVTFCSLKFLQILLSANCIKLLYWALSFKMIFSKIVQQSLAFVKHMILD